MKNKVRIIGGKWRGRKISFPDIEGLRPTQDRARETLFNWLMPYIQDAICLDLFAGSGVLGFEALSRGAKKVIAVDQNKRVVTALNENKDKLGVQNYELIQATIPGSIDFSVECFDVIFLDPPFKQNLASSSINWLIKRDLIKIGGLVYLETENRDLELPENFVVLKSKKTSTIIYSLLQRNF